MSQRTKALVLCGFLVAAAACHKSTGAEHLQKALKYVEDKKDQEAIVELRLALQADPKLGEARLKLAELDARTGNLKEALAQYVRAADQLPGSIDAQIKSGQFLLLARAFEDAKTRADRAIAIDPKNVDAQILLGNALAGLKDLDGAISEFEEALALDPSRNTASANLGVIQLVRGHRDEAEETFKKAVAASPRSVAAHLALANFLWASGRRDESEQIFKDTLAIDHVNVVANRALGLFYLATDRAAEAEPYFVTIAGASNGTGALALADYYIAMKRYDDARKTLRGLTNRPEFEATSTVRLASIDTLEGNRAIAQKRLHELLEKQPKNAPALLLSARLLAIDDKPDEALAAAKTLVTEDASSHLAPLAYLLIGQIHTASDRIEDAIDAYEQVLKLDKRPLAAELALARLSQARGDASKAGTFAEQALAIDPKNPDAQTLLIRSHVASGKIDTAKSELEPLRRAYPNSPTVADLAAFVELAQRNVDGARAWSSKALQLAPGDVEALGGLVQIDLAQKRTNDAAALIETALARAKPTASVELLTLAAQTYDRVGNEEKAETLFRQAIDADYHRVDARVSLGQLYVKLNRLGEADRELKKVIAQNPKSVAAHIALGMLFERRGNPDDAEREYQSVLSLDPRSIPAANNLAWMYVSGNRKLDEALQLARTVYQQLPDDPNVNDTLGWIYFRKNMAGEAIPYLKTSVSKVPTEAVFQFHFGMASMQNGNWDQAREALKKALQLQPDFEGAAEAKKALGIVGA